MEWDSLIEYKNRNKMWFNVDKPNEIQLQMLEFMANVKENYNTCHLFSQSYISQLYILTHPLISDLIKVNDVSNSIQIPLGFINFETFPEYKFVDVNKNKYSVIYIMSRCSFGKWPQVSSQIKQLSDIENTKINIGEILNLYLEGLARKFGHEQGCDYVILFNQSISKAVKSHKKNKWKINADIPLSMIIDQKSKNTALNIFTEMEYIDNSNLHMYKLVKVN